jgi:hypothetical protein
MRRPWGLPFDVVEWDPSFGLPQVAPFSEQPPRPSRDHL